MNYERILNADITVIGGGPGGIAAAIRGSSHGKRVILIEKNRLGGTIINHGCLHSKYFLHYTGLLRNINKLEKIGVKPLKINLDYITLLRNNEALVKRKIKEFKTLLKVNNVTVISGSGIIVSPKKILIEKEQKKFIIVSKSIIIATGSKPIIPQIIGKNIAVTSDLVFRLNRIPEAAIILGGGPEGVEIITMLNNLGVKTKIIELTNRLLPLEDHDIGNYLKQILIKNGTDIWIKSNVKSISEKDGVKTVILLKGQKEEKVSADLVILAMGRQPKLDGIGLENLSPKMVNGLLKVDNHMKTNIDNVYAAGDIIGGGMANVAIEQGIVASDNASGINSCFDQKIIPHSIYTSPEIASVGLTESQARQSGINLKIGKSYIKKNDRASIINEVDGFVKVLIDSSNDQIMGVHMIGNSVSEIISVATIAMNMEATSKNLSRLLVPYPTITSSFKDAIINAINQ